MMLFLGFVIPFAVALDLNREPPRDGMPQPGRCSLCKRQKEDTYRLTSEERVCADDIAGIIHRSGARRVRSASRPIGEWPLEKIAEHEAQLTPLDPWWNTQLK